MDKDYAFIIHRVHPSHCSPAYEHRLQPMCEALVFWIYDTITSAPEKLVCTVNQGMIKD